MSKEEYLLGTNTYNKNYDKVKSEKFSVGGLYDPRDILQVRYEAVLDLKNSKASANEIADKYGMNEKRVRLCRDALEEEGILGLMPEKKGPAGPMKLKEAERRFLDQYLASHPNASGNQATQALERETGTKVNKRTVERYLSKKSNGSQ